MATNVPALVRDYVARLLSYTEGKDPLAMQRQAPAILASLLQGADRQQLRTPPAPGKWSTGEILAHLADGEVAIGWRYRQILENPGCPLAAYDQDVWARLGDYAAWDPHDALELFRLLRAANIRLLERLTPEQWELAGVHAERGPVTVAFYARNVAGHDVNHIEQIRKLLGK